MKFSIPDTGIPAFEIPGIPGRYCGILSDHCDDFSISTCKL